MVDGIFPLGGPDSSLGGPDLSFGGPDPSAKVGAEVSHIEDVIVWSKRYVKREYDGHGPIWRGEMAWAAAYCEIVHAFAHQAWREQRGSSEAIWMADYTFKQ